MSQHEELSDVTCPECGRRRDALSLSRDGGRSRTVIPGREGSAPVWRVWSRIRKH
jgi:hypothetical protein